MFVVVLLSLVGTSFTSSLSYRAGHHTALINCPTCEHHVCDVNNLMQCEVCQIVIPHKDQPPQNVKCTQAGHCHEDHHNHCCDNEGCVASIVGCPTCQKGECDFINRDQCFMCKFDLHDGQLPHVHCLQENENCDPTHHNTLCCSDEHCIAQAFGHYYPTSHSVTSTTTAAPTDVSTTSNASSTNTAAPINVSTTSTLSSSTTADTHNAQTTSAASFVTTAPYTSTAPDSSSVSSAITDVNTSTDSVSSTTSSTITAPSSFTTSTNTDTNQSFASSSSNTTASISTASQGHENCSDDINNCELWKSYGVCHAVQEQTSMYALALQCKATCRLCTDLH